MKQISIRPMLATDRERWLEMWAGYLEFYETSLSTGQTDLTWSRLLDPGCNMNGVVAEYGTEVVGFAQYVMRVSSWEECESCYLEDLFVDPEVRGKGVGEALIADVARIAREQKSPSLHWKTNEHNATARRLYDKVANKTPFIEYEIDLG